MRDTLPGGAAMKILIPIIMICLTGCARLQYNHAVYGNFSYWRIGNSDVAGIRLVVDGHEIYLERATAANDNLVDGVGKIVGGAL
jgi:hypothetical protein